MDLTGRAGSCTLRTMQTRCFQTPIRTHQGRHVIQVLNYKTSARQEKDFRTAGENEWQHGGDTKDKTILFANCL